MKIILSRKGFDSSSGKIPSPILPDGKLFSLPIPIPGDPITYDQIHVDGRSAAKILADLCPSGYRFKGAVAPCPWEEIHAHLDPDLRAGALSARCANWRPLFGACDAAQAHLDAKRVGKGDLFLFFGWFKQTQWDRGKLTYTPRAPDLHLIFGWLEVGDVWRLGARHPDTLPASARYHPHAVPDYGRNNTIYAAAVQSGTPDLPRYRAGAFARFHSRLQLTAPDSLRSVWRLPKWFYPKRRLPLSFHGDLKRWDRCDNYATLRTVGRGQEFVLDTADYPEALAWADAILTLPTAQ